MMSDNDTKGVKSSVNSYIVPLVVILLVIFPFLLFGQEFEAWAIELTEGNDRWVLVGIGVSLLAFDVVLPVPSSILAILLSARLGTIPGTMAIVSGLTLGSCVGYILGRLSTQLAGTAKAQADGFGRLSNLRFGILSVAVFRPVPVLAETSSILAGHYRMPFGAFFLVSLLANIAVGVTYALIGHALSPEWAYLVGMVLVALSIIACAKLFIGNISALFFADSD